MSRPSSLLGRFCGGSVCDLGGSGYCLWGLEGKVCKKSLCNNNGILYYRCEAVRGGYVNTSTYLYLVFLCIYGYRGLFSWLVCIL